MWYHVSEPSSYLAITGAGIDKVLVGNAEVAVTEESVTATPFGTLLHFKKDIPVRQPRVLVVAPLSGHFATLLASTIRTLLADHDVYVTDWHNARDVPASAGRFDFDDYVEHVIRFLEAIGPGAHVLAVFDEVRNIGNDNIDAQ